MLEVIYHWHSFVEIANHNWSIFIDPFITGNPVCDITLESINKDKIKAIILTHGHQDHIGDTFSLLTQKKDLPIFATYEIGNFLQSAYNAENVFHMHVGWERAFQDFEVKFVSAVHWGGIWESNAVTGLATWVIVRIDGKSIYHAWDTALNYDMKLLSEYDKIDLAFLPIGWNFTMGIDDAVIATSFVKPKTVVPIHYNTWWVIAQDPIDFARKVMSEWFATPKVLNPWQKIVY